MANFKGMFRRWPKQFLARAGFEFRRLPPPRVPPPMIEDPMEAMSLNRSGRTVVVRAPIEQCVVFNGLSLSPTGWHPFVAAAREILATGRSQFEGSALDAYYRAWQPANALEALIGAPGGPEILESYPPYLMYAPWLEMSADERLASMQQIIEMENAVSGADETAAEGGHGLQGPVSITKARIEYRRLLDVLRSIQASGFNRSLGDITAQVLKRGDEYRFRIAHGHHRAAALAALGYDHVPVVPKKFIDLGEAPHWPRVHRGPWSQGQAETFLNHHFDFDSLHWARALGMRPYGAS